MFLDNWHVGTYLAVFGAAGGVLLAAALWSFCREAARERRRRRREAQAHPGQAVELVTQE